MAAITIRDLDDEVKERLRVRAAINGRSMEAEARSLIEAAVSIPPRPKNIAVAFLELSQKYGPFELEQPSRDEPYERPLPFSDEWERERAEYLASLDRPSGRDAAA